jgi:glycosyltransferase involved in cell wall biosynthesis
LCSKHFRKHGYVLDEIFHESRDENLLLIDSDLEIRDPEVVKMMLDAVATPGVFGSGAIHGAAWLSPEHRYPENVALFRERMWIPFTMLHVASVQKALGNGYSFINHWIPNEIPQIPWLARLLRWRFYVPGVKQIRADFLRGLRRTYGGSRPHVVCCDTGANVFCYLRDHSGERFVDFGIGHFETLVYHYHGITRLRLNRHEPNAVAVNDILQEVLQRLRQEYNVSFSSEDPLQGN